MFSDVLLGQRVFISSRKSIKRGASIRDLRFYKLVYCFVYVCNVFSKFTFDDVYLSLQSCIIKKRGYKKSTKYFKSSLKSRICYFEVIHGLFFASHGVSRPSVR